MEDARISDGARVIGAGIPITIGGDEHRLRFDFEALEIVEEEFDGLLQFTTALNGGYRTKRFKAIRVGLLAGLAHEDLTRGDIAKLTTYLQGTLKQGFDEFNGVHQAICEAFDQAIPPPSKKKASKASAQENASIGPTSSGELSEKSESSQTSSAA